MKKCSRRNFLVKTPCGALPLLLGTASLRAEARKAGVDEVIETGLRAQHIPGLAACVVKSGRVVWSKGYGWANIKKRVPMSPEHTVQNIGSISKTVVATAVMQLWEKGKFQLDDDVNEFLPFPVRNPFHPDTPITVRLLLTHRSAIADSPAYGSSYASGDPSTPLERWLKEYFTPGGRYYQKGANFHPWKPGKQNSYSNVGFGILGYLVERVSGGPFPHYTKENIFKPLGMKKTAWLLSDIDVATHAVPYVPTGDGPPGEELEAYQKFGILGGEAERDAGSGDYRPLCLYSFPNYPDGALRTSVNQLARFLLAYVNNGSYAGTRILAADTVRLMLTPQAATTPQQGLCWATAEKKGQRHWGHNGADPGIRTNMSFRASDGVGVIVFVNRAGVDLAKINDCLFEESGRL
jgi:CubicO group peptidase (beta-lactamase class C family)